MQIYTNSLSFTANRHLNVANRALEKSVEGLSSGLRINRSSDDVAGMAVFEKLQIQLKGMAKAAISAQNGISFLQVADSSMGVIGDMLQRMRELAVEAGDATFTANDRRALQAELEQLKADIDRISVETDFNTHKLLSGDASGLWSSSNAGIDVILTGAPAGGNYKLEFSVEPGQNAVYKTNIFSTESLTTRNLYTVSGYTSLATTATVNMSSAAVSISSLGRFDAGYSVHYGSGTTGYPNNIGAGALLWSTGGLWGTDSLNSSPASNPNCDIVVMLGSSPNNMGFYIAVEYNGIADVLTVGSSSATNFKFTLYSVTSDETVTLDIVTSLVYDPGDGNGVMEFNCSTTSVMSFWGSAPNMIINFSDISHITPGAKALMGITHSTSTAITPADDTQRVVSMDVPTAKAGNMNFAQYPDTNDSQLGFQTPRVLWDKDNGDLQYNVVTIDNTGEFRVMKTVLPVSAFETASNKRMVEYVALPVGEARLMDVAQFTDSNGRMLLDNTRKLTLLGNNKTADIYLDKYNTLQELNDKIAYAIAITLEMGDPDVDISRLAHIVTATGSGNDAVKGTIVIQGAMTGRNSEIRFVADEDILKALSIEQIQQSENDVITMNVFDAHTEQYINSDISIDYMMRGVIKGVNIKLNPNIITSAKMGVDGNIVFEQDANLDPQYIHIANRETDTQIGANAGQYMDISVGRVDTVSLEINDVYLTTLPDSQRALFKIDSAIKNVVQQRAEIGSRINRMEYALKSLSIGQQNILAASSRIRDIDMAKASAEFAKNQIMMNAATAMLAQANQLPQMALQLINR
ncbi:flagellin [Deferribacterales bacterium]|nr:flagellin [Deferribacterales bacterium]